MKMHSSMLVIIMPSLKVFTYIVSEKKPLLQIFTSHKKDYLPFEIYPNPSHTSILCVILSTYVATMQSLNVFR